MVRMTRGRPVTVFRVFDRDGRPIGDVVQPEFEPLEDGGQKPCCWSEVPLSVYFPPSTLCCASRSSRRRSITIISVLATSMLDAACSR